MIHVYSFFLIMSGSRHMVPNWLIWVGTQWWIIIYFFVFSLNFPLLIHDKIRDYWNCHHRHNTEIMTAFHTNQILSPYFVLIFFHTNRSHYLLGGSTFPFQRPSKAAVLWHSPLSNYPAINGQSISAPKVPRPVSASDFIYHLFSLWTYLKYLCS